MTVRAEFRRELERAAVAYDKVNAHLAKAADYAVAGNRPELDEPLLAIAKLNTVSKENIQAVHDAM